MAGLDALALSDELTALARARAGRDPDGLIRELCALADTVGGWRRPAVESLLGDVLIGVVAPLSPDEKAALGRRLAAADWPPAELIGLFAREAIELARPLIAHSPRLDEDVRLSLLHEGSLEHRLEVARGPRLSAEAADVIIAAAEPVMLTALAENPAACLSETQLMTLVDAAGQNPSLRAPLARHRDLTPEAARELQERSDEPTRALLAQRFGPAPAAIESDAERIESEARLVAKLKAADQLRPSYLLRSLRDGRLSLFSAALASLADCEPEPLRRHVDRADPETLALACAAVGIDRSVFPTLLGLVQNLARVEVGPSATPAAALALPPDAAAEALRARLATV